MIRRMQIDFSGEGWDNLIRAGWYDYQRAQAEQKKHLHLNQMEIIYCSKGYQVYEVEGEYYQISGGEYFVTFPNEKHSTGTFPEEKGELFWIVFNLPVLVNLDFLGFDEEEKKWINRYLLNLEKRKFIGSNKTKYLLNSIFSIWKKGIKNEPEKRLQIRHYLRSFLLDFIDCSKKSEDINSSKRFLHLKDYIEANVEQNLPIEHLAGLVHLSVSRFKGWFKEEAGVPPSEYIHRRKIELSKSLLKERGSSITDIAYQLGYSSSQYFATVFKKFTRQTPSQFIGNL